MKVHLWHPLLLEYDGAHLLPGTGRWGAIRVRVRVGLTFFLALSVGVRWGAMGTRVRAIVRFRGRVRGRVRGRITAMPRTPRKQPSTSL